MEVEANTSGQTQAKTKFCKHCGGTIPQDAVMCTHCGRQVEKLAGAAQPQVVIQNTNMNTNTAAAVVAGVGARAKNKWTAFVLCLLLGYFGAHKFYEGKVGMGVLYLFTLGLFGIGWFVDLIVLLTKNNPYYVYSGSALSR